MSDAVFLGGPPCICGEDSKPVLREDSVLWVQCSRCGGVWADAEATEDLRRTLVECLSAPGPTPWSRRVFWKVVGWVISLAWFCAWCRLAGII